jgi:integral membrane protein
MSNLKFHLHWSSITEGISYLLLLCVTMPLKYFCDMPKPTTYVGMVHGILFVWYVFSVLGARGAQKISNGQTLIALLASIIPLGTFYADKAIFSKIK